MAKLDQKFFFFNYFDQLDNLVDLVESDDHFELLNTNLEFFVKLSIKNATDSTKNDRLIQMMENLLNHLLNKKQHDHFNHDETKFIIIFSEIFNLYNDVSLNEKINTLILNNDLVDLELKVEVIQNLFKKKLVNLNSSFYIDFIFRSLVSLFDDIERSTSNQQRTKLISGIIWILFDFLSNDLFFDHLADSVDKFLSRIVENAKLREEDQLIESTLDFIVSLIRFNEKDTKNEIKIEHIQKIKSIIDNDKTKEFIIKSILNKANSSIRKKSRYITNQLEFLSLDTLEILEGLEEKQLHLIKPILDKKLSLLVSKNSKLKIGPYETVMEIIVERMLNHDCKTVKLYALNFTNEQYKCLLESCLHSKIEFFLTEEFILNQIISALNDSQIYNEEFYDGQPLDLLNLVPKEKVLKSLLAKQDNITTYGLFFILKKLDSNYLDYQKNKISLADEFDKSTVQKLFSLIDDFCSDKLLKSTCFVCLVRIFAYSLKKSANDFKFLLNLLNCLKIKSIKLQSVLSYDILALFNDYSDDLSLVNEFNLVGYANYWSVLFNQRLNSDKFYPALKQLSSTDSLQFKSFLIKFLKSITVCDETLWNFFCDNNLIDLDVLQLVCVKELTIELAQIISKYLIDLAVKNEDQSKLSYLALLNVLHTRNSKLDDHQLVTELDKAFNQTKLKFNTLDKMHWKLINNYLNQKNNFNLDQLVDVLNCRSTESKSDFIFNLISTTPTNLNVYAIEFLGLILKNELHNETSKEIVLNNFFVLIDLVFDSCLEIAKVGYYVKLFKVFIERFAFTIDLFHSRRGLQFLNDKDNFDNLSILFDRINNLNTLHVRSLLIDHICNLVKDDPLLVKNELFQELLFKCLEIGYLFDREGRNLTDYIKTKLQNEKFVDNYLNMELKLDFYQATRLNAVSTCLILDLDSLNTIVNKMIYNENGSFKYANVRNFPNTYQHKEQTKILQLLLIICLKLLKILDNNLSSQENKQKIIGLLRLIFDASIAGIINQSSSQLSVKILKQVIIITLIKDKNCPSEFYDDFKGLLSFEFKSKYLVHLATEDNDNSKVSFISTVLSIVYHLVDSKSDIKYFPFNYLVTCNHYRTRLFSHLVLLKCGPKFSVTTTDSKSDLQVEIAPRSISGSHNVVRNLKLLQDDWFFALLDFENDLNLNLIFNYLPKLTAMNDDLIDLTLIEKYFKSCSINLQNPESKLANAVKSDFSRPERTNDIEDDDNQKEIFQRKHIAVPELELDTDQRKQTGELIMCASFIERATNLGGLTRTSEIFGVRKLIVPNNHVLKNKDYLSLSVSAEKWIDIEEVHYWDLVNYLKELKTNLSYSLIGIEQSTGSISLHEFKFPKKSIIVLGNEKEGLPVHILQMMDYIIEIPQVGIIKSLNVHVTGSIIAYEYARQYLRN